MRISRLGERVSTLVWWRGEVNDCPLPGELCALIRPQPTYAAHGQPPHRWRRRVEAIRARVHRVSASGLDRGRARDRV
eukprot:556054-Prymnesium_polylepis.1